MVAVGDCSVGDSRLRRTPYIIDWQICTYSRTTRENVSLIHLSLVTDMVSYPGALWQAILLFIMQNRYLICHIRYLI